MMECRRGDIYFVDFGRDTESNLQCGIRPALVVSNNRANENSPVISTRFVRFASPSGTVEK